MRILGSWSPRVSRPVAKLGCIQPNRGVRIIKHFPKIHVRIKKYSSKLDFRKYDRFIRQEKGRKIEEHSPDPQRFSKSLKHAINKGIDGVSKPESNGQVLPTRSLGAPEGDKPQLRHRQSFFTQIQPFDGSHNGSIHAKGDGRKGSLGHLSKDRSSSKDAESFSFNAQFPGGVKASPARSHTSLSQDSPPIPKNSASRADLNSKVKDAQFAPQMKQKRPSKTPKLSLFEELFPEEAARRGLDENSVHQQDQEFPRLPLPETVEDDGAFEDEYVRGGKLDSETAETASKDAYHLWNPSILVLSVGSPSLDESDFRRIAPRGQHIEEWVGPGDFFKVIPGRDTVSLKQETHYWLVFPNPAYARAYQNQVIHLHNLARTHTPTSIESPMKPPKGMFLNGEEVHKLLEDYALCPPSQKISLLGLFPPLGVALNRIVRYKGYPELTQPRDKTGKAVRFWVEGFVPTLEQIQGFIGRDGRHRGMAWALMDGKDSIQQIDPDGSRSNEEDGTEHEHMEHEGKAFRDYVSRTKIRWIIAFEDENEARRFVRRWHLRPFPTGSDDRERRGDHAPIVHAEYMW